MTTRTPSGAEDLVWGHGPRVLETFLEPTCPFSGRAFEKFTPLLAEIGDDKLMLKIRLNSQPWHTFSSIVCRAVFAAAAGPEGKAGAHRVLSQVFEHRQDFVLQDHCQGPHMASSPAQILDRIETLTDLQLSQDFSRKEITQDMKWHAKYARQNGIHGTPTFMVDGLIRETWQSGDALETWVDALSAD